MVLSDMDADNETYDEADLIKIMSDSPMTYGWDVVSCLDAEKITELFEELYDDEEHSGLVYHISTTHVSTNTSTYYSGTEFNGTVGPPLISFINNQPDIANLTMVFSEGHLVKTSLGWNDNGSLNLNLTTDIVYADGNITETQIVISDGHVDTNTTTTKPVSEIPNIVGLMQLSKLIGSVDNQHKVIINLGKGTFNTKLTLDPNIDDDLSNAVQNYFRTDLANYNYTLGTVQFNTSDTPPALQPTLFVFSTSVPKGSTHGILLMFIKTNTSDSEIGAQRYLKLSANPIPKNRTATLIISNKVLITHFILPKVQEQVSSSANASSPRPYDDPYSINGSGYMTVDKFPISTNHLEIKVADGGSNLTLTWNENWNQSIIIRNGSVHQDVSVHIVHVIGILKQQVCQQA